jgi:uncharacterized membrane protein
MMSVQSVLPTTDSGRRTHWLFLVSLAFNLVFVGAAGAVALRYSSPVPLATVARIDHSLVSRFNRIAAALPPSDAQIMRAQLNSEAQKVASAQADLRLSQDDLRKSLRADPFDPEAMHAAMAENRTARENFDEVLHEMIAAAASQMSIVGRTKLAEWPAERENARPLR